MNLSFHWLNDYLDTSLLPPPREYSERMTATGSKVEGYTRRGEEITNVVVGRIRTVEKHPDADKLQICMVDVGEGADLQIVTGAKNIRAGDLVPVAKDGASLPGGVRIKKGKLRGVESAGMLCSIAELDLTPHDMPNADPDGILILTEPREPGDDIKDVLLLDDLVVEFEITSNRPDCFSMIGLARESGVSFDLPVTIPVPVIKNADRNSNIRAYLSVAVQDQTLCPRYSARVIKNVKIQPSPLWMRARLKSVGIRPINNIVDITNYVMIEYGQPMHAFDHSYLEGGKIIVRRAKNGETITTLDGVTRTLNETMLLICDEKKPVGVAGVMGGENSEINADTKTVVFESANFSGSSVRITARDLGIRTESSGRFEKGLDPENTRAALERACELVELLGAGTVVDGEIDCYGTKAPKKTLKFSPEKINALLGTAVSEKEMLRIFQSLHCAVEGDTLTPPTWRPDIGRTADLAEEIARIYGYNNIPSTHFKSEARIGGYNEPQLFRERINELCVACGLYQINTYSFISPKTFDLLTLPADSPLRDAIVILNPLGEDTSIMRTTAMGNMLGVLSKNRSYRNPGIGLYELSKVYFKQEGGDLADERQQLVVGLCDKGDFYDLKGICESIADEFEPNDTGALKRYEVVPRRDNGVYHPGRCAAMVKDGKTIAVFGQIHPRVQANYGIDLPVYAAEIDLDLLYSLKAGKKEYRPLPKFPAVTRDLAFVCDKALPIGALEKTIAKYAGGKLESVALFDLYTGAQLEENKKNVAFTLVLRDREKTLTMEEADKICAKIIRGAEHELGAKLR